MEVLKMTPELDDMLAHQATAREIKEAALSSGFRSISEDGVRRVLLGHTSLEEVSRVADLTERLA
jgi:general secretion pathway protein E/type IV pilus assembly protein PilB